MVSSNPMTSMDAPLHLRPMSIGEILDRSFRLYRNHFVQLFVAVLVVMCVEFIGLQFYLAYCFAPLYQYLTAQRELPPLDSPLIGNAALGTIGFALAHIVLNLLYLGALIHLIHNRFMSRAISLGDAYRLTWRRFGPLFRVNWLKLGILGACLALWLGPILIAVALKTWWLAAAWVITGAFPVIFSYLWLALASIVLLLEDRRPIDSLKRSGRLMFVLSEKGVLRNNAFRISIILLVIFAIRSFVMMVGQAPFMAWKTFEMYRDPSLLGQYHRTAFDSLFEFINMMMQAVTTPFGLATLVLFYFDIRIRKEGLDLSLRLQSLRERLGSGHGQAP